MTITIEAIFENGMLRPAQPLPLKEHEKVRVTVESVNEPVASSPAEAEQMVRRSYGLLGWTGDAETLRRIAEDTEFSITSPGERMFSSMPIRSSIILRPILFSGLLVAICWYGSSGRSCADSPPHTSWPRWPTV
jgi:predicted DNA-binding antitoxin AbrB/MazE fold protein